MLDEASTYAEALDVHKKRVVNLAKMGAPPPPPPPRPKHLDAKDGAPPIGMKQMKAMDLMVASSKQRREKSTRRAVEEEEMQLARRRQREAKQRDGATPALEAGEQKSTRRSKKGSSQAATLAATDPAAMSSSDGEMLGADVESRGASIKIRDGPRRIGERSGPLPAAIPKLHFGEPRKKRASKEEMVAAAMETSASAQDPNFEYY